MKTRLLFFLAFFISSISVKQAQASDYYWIGTGTNSNWNTSNNWAINTGLGVYPTSSFPVAGDNAYIGVNFIIDIYAFYGGFRSPTVNASAACSNLIIGSDRSFTLTVNAALAVSSSLHLYNGSTITLSTTLTIPPGCTVTNDGNINSTNGPIVLNGNPVTFNNTANGNININSTLTAATSVLKIAPGSTLNNSGDIVVTATSSVSSIDLTGNPSVLTNNSGSTFTVTAATINIAPGGTLTNKGAITKITSSPINLTGNPSKFVNQNNGTTIGSCTITGNSNAITMAAGSSITNTGSVLTIASAPITMNNATMSNSNDPPRIGNFTISSSTMGMSSNSPFTNAGTFTVNLGSTINLNDNPESITNSTGANFFLDASTINFKSIGTSILNAGTFTASNNSFITSTSASQNQKINNTGTFYAGASNSMCTITLNGTQENMTNSGTFYLGSTSILNLKGGASGQPESVSNTGTFTLQSDPYGSASIGTLSTYASLSGTYNVQRYMSGGAGRRGYRLMSSPVNTTTMGPPATATPASTVQSLQKTTPITGWGITGTYSASSPTSAFDPSPLGNPSVFFYYEPDADPANRKINVSDYKALSTITDALPAGNGFLYFFRGDRTASATKFLTTGSPENTTLNNTGTLTQGDIKVYIPTDPRVTYSGSIKQYQTAQATSTLTTVFSKTTTTTTNTDGFHLVGNPYACTIDLEEALKTANFTNQPTGNNYIYGLTNTGAFGSYLLVGGTAAGGITRWIGSGQGFFIKSSGSSTLTFHEACKLTLGYTLPTSFATAQNTNMPNQVLHINLMLDSANANETVVQFGYRHASNKFISTEDAPYVTGPEQTTFLTSYSSGNVPCLINQMNTLDSVKSITLYAGGPASGRYTLSFSGAESLDSRYKIFLKDSFLKDSLDLSANKIYQFDLDLNNPKTFGDTRFSLVVQPTHIQDLYQLTAFTGKKFNSSVQLDWTTAHEGYYTTFKVQRSTDGGKTFTTITELPSDASGAYGFSDTNPALNGSNQYRIVQIVGSTVTKTSSLVTVTYTNPDEPVTATNVLKVYPNPAATTLNVSVKTAENGGPVTMRIYNMRSQQIMSHTFSKNSALNMDVSKLITGIYVVHVTDNTKDYGSATFTKL